MQHNAKERLTKYIGYTMDLLVGHFLLIIYLDISIHVS